jgi:hypothetical protein
MANAVIYSNAAVHDLVSRASNGKNDGMRKPRYFLVSLLFFGLLLPFVAAGQSTPEIERQKIESLIDHVGELKDARFIRNGKEYDVAVAVRFLRGKWKANDKEVKTARDFVDKVASASGTSGKPYRIRFKDGREIASRDFLIAELKKQEG